MNCIRDGRLRMPRQAARGGLDRLVFVDHTQFRYLLRSRVAIDYRVFCSYDDEGATIVVVLAH